ncbi:MAG TPA: hypothetical protein VGD66_01615 [Allosphingosinicella sp.]|jgi:hypothetical protein
MSLRIQNLHATVAGKPILAGMLAASILSGCSGESGAGAAPKAQLRCSDVRNDYQKDRERVARRVEELRRARDAARPAESAQDREFQRLMADIERSERRFAVRSKECVEK